MVAFEKADEEGAVTINIAYQRLRSQHLEGEPLHSAAEVVGWLGAVQAQEYAGAKWALGLRLRRTTEAAIEQAFDAGAILRTHVMRPTWHFVTPEDIRWMLALTAERVTSRMAYYDRQIGLNAAVYRQSGAALAKAMEGGKQLTRAEVTQALARAGIEAEGQRFIHLLMRAELEGLICSGARRGKQFTYTLMDERAPMPSGGQLTREEALAELTRRYFTSHGPAMLQDFGWWSGLTLADGKAGIEMASEHLEKATVDGKTYWFAAGTADVEPLTGLAAGAAGTQDAAPAALRRVRYRLQGPQRDPGGRVRGAGSHRPVWRADGAGRARIGLLAQDDQQGQGADRAGAVQGDHGGGAGCLWRGGAQYGEFIEMEVEVK